MKKLFLLSFAIMIMIFSEISAKPNMDVSFGFFYSSLRPYGEWIELDRDIYAWRPMNISSHWKPYNRGRWIWSSNGWYWDSYEPFGWAVYHYGRWYFDDYYGWVWMPDYEWGPSWVEWRYDDDYIGWAPLPPYASFNINFGIRFSIGWTSSYHWWNFVSYHRFCDSRLDYYVLDSRRIERIFSHTKYRNNYYFERDRIINGGIDRDLVERRGGYRIAEREIRSVDNRSEFERARRDNDGRVYSFKPSDNEINRSSNNDRFEIRKNDRTSSIERDKISTPTITRNNDISIDRRRDNERNVNSRETRNDRNEIERKSPENTGMNREPANRETNRTFENPKTERNNVERKRESTNNYERNVESNRSSSSERPSYRREESSSSRSESRSSSRESRSRESNRSSERRR